MLDESMEKLIDKGWLTGCCHIQSNHYNLRTQHLSCDKVCGTAQIYLVVLHCISLPEGEYENQTVEKLFTLHANDQDSQMIIDSIKKEIGRVSAHLYIKRSGERIQFVPLNYRAWHAGESMYQNVRDCNNFSVGIELQGRVGGDFTPHQYRSLQRVTKMLGELFPHLKANDRKRCKIVGHSEISPERKGDPGSGFDWEHFWGLF